MIKKILCLIILILILYYSFNNYINNYINNLKKYNLHDVYDNIIEGDIVLFRWKNINILENIFKIFTHVGIIIEINGKKYVLESHYIGDTNNMGYYNYNGVNIYEFKHRISMYEGDTFILKINTIYNNSFNIQSKLKQYLEIPFNDNINYYMLSYCIPNLICNECITLKKSLPNNLFCSQFIGYVLKDNGLLDLNYNINCLIPRHFLNITNKYGKIYNELYKIII